MSLHRAAAVFETCWKTVELCMASMSAWTSQSTSAGTRENASGDARPSRMAEKNRLTTSNGVSHRSSGVKRFISSIHRRRYCGYCGKKRMRKELLHRGCHYYANRHWNAYGETGWLEKTALRINAEDDYVSAVLVSCQQVASAWIEGEVSRGHSLGRSMAEAAKFSCFGVDGKDGDAVVTAVRAVKKAA